MIGNVLRRRIAREASGMPLQNGSRFARITVREGARDRGLEIIDRRLWLAQARFEPSCRGLKIEVVSTFESPEESHRRNRILLEERGKCPRRFAFLARQLRKAGEPPDLPSDGETSSASSRKLAH
jgi:hypothetical protein